MKSSTAYKVLPSRLLRQLQSYWTGLLWVPSRTRRRFKTAGDAARNVSILRWRAKGWSIRRLARRFHLSSTRVFEIVSQPPRRGRRRV